MATQNPVSPGQIFANCLDYLKGYWEGKHVDFVGKIDPSIDPSCVLNGGRCVHVSANTPVVNGQGRVDSLFQPGATGTHMPIFLIQGQFDYDVANNGNGQTDPYGFTSIAPAGFNSGLVAAGSFELATTEFDTTQGVVYGPNDVLHSPTQAEITTGTDFSNAGMLFKVKNWPGGSGQAAPGVDNICGVVSRGAYVNHNRQNVLAFWPVYLPEIATLHS